VSAIFRALVIIAVGLGLNLSATSWQAAQSRDTVAVTTGRAAVATAAPMPTSRVPSIAAAQRWARAQLGARQYACLYALVQRESRWRVDATNRRSGAYGLPQALPGSKMAAFGRDWRTNPKVQLHWMIHYVNARYGSACRAYQRALERGWY